MRAAFVEVARHVIKLDDIASILAKVAAIPSFWTTRKLLLENTFFVACPSFEMVHNLLTLYQIHGNGFSLFIDH